VDSLLTPVELQAYAGDAARAACMAFQANDGAEFVTALVSLCKFVDELAAQAVAAQSKPSIWDGLSLN
jgi:hypothetical protein